MPRVSDAERIEMIALYRQGIHQRRIAEITGRALSTVNRVLKAYKTEGRLLDLPHGSRPRSTTAEEDLLIIAAAVDNPFFTAEQIKNELGLNVDVQVVRQRLHEAGLRSRTAARKPLLSDHHKAARLLFAQSHKDWTAEDWGQVMFTDESTFTTKCNERLKVWRRDNHR